MFCSEAYAGLEILVKQLRTLRPTHRAEHLVPGDSAKAEGFVYRQAHLRRGRTCRAVGGGEVGQGLVAYWIPHRQLKNSKIVSLSCESVTR